MSDLIPFHQIDQYANECWDDDNNYIGPWSDAQLEAADFLGKMDNEGGIDGLYNYGGVSQFPEELRSLAYDFEVAYEALKEAINLWAAERGVSY